MSDATSTTPSSPERSAGRIPAEYQALLGEFEQRSIEDLGKRIQHFLERVIAQLFEQSIRGDREDADNVELYESVKVLKLNQGRIAADYLEEVSSRFRDLVPDQPSAYQWRESEQATERLDLLDLEEFEDLLALDRMINTGQNLHGEVLEYLTVRLATAIGADPLSLRLPIHVSELCTALRTCLNQQGVRHSALPRIFTAFIRHFLRPLEDFYTPLNKLLRDAGLYPDLEEEVLTKGSLLQRLAAEAAPERPYPDREAASKTSRDPNALRQVMEEVVEQAGASLAPAALYRSVVDALKVKRELDGSPATVEGRDGPLAGADTVVDALAPLQKDAALHKDILEAGSLRDYLSNNRDKISGLHDTAGLDADSLNQLDLVDSLFSTIHTQLNVSQRLQSTLDSLRIPLARLALLEPHFLVDESHAGRSVVEKLSQLATPEGFSNPVLEERVQGIVDDIVTHYDRDSDVFGQALHKIEGLVEQQASAQKRNVERVVRTQEGQQRLRRARAQVDAAIHQRLDTPHVPQVLLNLIERGWRDLLVLTHVREGPDSENWQQYLQTLDLIKDWLSDQDESSDAKAVQRGLEAGPFVDMLEQQIATEFSANVELTPVFAELRSVLSGEQPATTAEPSEAGVTEPAAPGELRQRLAKTLRLRRWVNRVDQLQPGTWLTYRNRRGERRRMQLAWINEERDQFIFVNDRGQKTAEMNPVQLARKLSQGAKPPSPADNLSVVGQSMYGTLEDVQKSLSFSRNHDQLTKLINRDTFIDQLGRALRHAYRKSSQHAVLYLNIDRFSLVNEVYDNVTGDQVLAEFARLLSQLHGSKISSARLGKDDFGILLVDHDMERAMTVAEKIRADIEASSVDIDGELVSFTVSIGVAPLLDYSPDVDTVLKAATTAMRTAKERGRNQVTRYEESWETVQRYRRDRNQSRQSIEQALATERFVLRAQPIVQSAVSGGRPSGQHYELLLGLKESSGELVSPEQFIVSAERYGFITAIDRWVVNEAFRWISQLMDEQKVVPNLAINLSGTSITDDAFMEYLFEQISEFGVGTNRLCFEITETGTISNLVKAADFVRAFRNIGCKFSLDDFGTGLASHNYLRELPVDYVKIDGTFITDIDDNPNDFTMARSINDLAHFLGQETIAESVENERIIARLEEIGVDYLQGWGVGHPKPLDEVALELSSIEK